MKQPNNEDNLSFIAIINSYDKNKKNNSKEITSTLMTRSYSNGGSAKGELEISFLDIKSEI